MDDITPVWASYLHGKFAWELTKDQCSMDRMIHSSNYSQDCEANWKGSLDFYLINFYPTLLNLIR